jgi:flagellar biosynthesis component FlhA
VAKYAKTTYNSDGTSETRIHTDYTATAAEGAGKVAGGLLWVIFSQIFKTKTSFGIVSAIVGFLLLFAGSSGAIFWGLVLLLGGIGFTAWGVRQQLQVKAEADRLVRYAQYQAREAASHAEQLANAHSIPPTEPAVALASGEKELTRFWTKEGDKALLTNQRLILDQAGGSVSIIRIADIRAFNAASQHKYDGAIHIPTVVSPNQTLNFSSAAESQRVLSLLRGAVLGTA